MSEATPTAAPSERDLARAAKAVAQAEKAAAKQVVNAEKAEAKQEARDAKAQAKRDRAAEILAKYGRVAAQAAFGGSAVAIYDKGFVRVGLMFISDSTPFEELRSISYSRTVQDKSLGGRAGAAMVTGGLSLLASNENRDTFLSIATDQRARTLKATGRSSESAGLSLEAAGKGVLDALRAKPATSAPAAHLAPAPAQAAATSDLTEQIVKLAQLHAQGILSDDEFTKAKAKALGI